MKVSVFLTDGFETVEALAVVDLLRRAGIKTETVSITENQLVTSAQAIPMMADAVLQKAELEDADVLFLPGGPGHVQYMECDKLKQLLVKHSQEGKRIAAICAAPSVLGKLGLLEGRKATCFPGYEKDLRGADVQDASVRVVTDGNITTSRGMGTSIDLGLELVRLLAGKEKADELGRTTQYC